ncbi:uncharacterized protein [Clytia hemisphaerica]|uniref:Cnidarian restricted protein n=1 Tax=Clytia hemisphaerica TaxID=252671 RepID=A0A7M5WX50_9CNID
MGLFIYCVTMATLVVQVTAQPDGQPAVIVNSKFAVDEHNKIRKLYDYTNNELLNQGPLAVNLKLANDAKDCIDLMFQNIEKPEWQSKYHPCNPSKKSQGENILHHFHPLDQINLKLTMMKQKPTLGGLLKLGLKK